jgi:type IV pilus biogenesis protein CpaD/CtpE
MNRKLSLAVSLSALIALSAGCSSQRTNEPEPEAKLGDAVRSVMNSQINNYEAAIHPNPDAVEGSDPYRLDTVLTTYRGHVSKPAEVRAPLEISVGGN